jgi:hypothetical protein
MFGFINSGSNGGGGGAVTSVNGQTGVVVVTKSDVGLGNADNTSDVNKPVSAAQQTALNNKADLVLGFVPLSQLPVETLTTYVNTYADLPLPNTVPGQKYGVINSQGTSWLPGSLGGTYYSKGYYYSNGTIWIYMGDFPFQATQADVDAGIITNQFVSPNTFFNSSKWSNYQTQAQVRRTSYLNQT